MSRFDQAKMLMKVKKLQKELQKQIITVEQGDGAVKVEITGEQKIKRIHIDPEAVDVDDIRVLERWIEDAVKDAISQSLQKKCNHSWAHSAISAFNTELEFK